MIIRYHDTEIRKSLREEFDSGVIEEIGDYTIYAEGLESNFPFVGSKIAWRRVPGAVGHLQRNVSLQTENLRDFVGKVSKDNCLTGNFIYIGDNLTSFAIRGPISILQDILPKLMEIPQHHYFLDENFLWCLTMTMEGEMDFGFKPDSSLL